jgi:TctA family transporter
MWIEGFLTALQPLNLVYLLAGSAFGLVIGALPTLRFDDPDAVLAIPD